MKVTDDDLCRMESNYPGIREQIVRFESAVLPLCPSCGSTDTADVQCGIIGRTISIASATTKMHLVSTRANRDAYFCNSCRGYFGTLPSPGYSTAYP